jgi:phage baseplate assembly protein W
MSGDKTFLGSGWAFPPEFNKTGVRMVAAERDIRESLHILLSTVPGERVMQPTFGCGLKAQMFENLNEGSVAIIKDLIQRAILFFEPRITLELIEISDEKLLQGEVSISIDYWIRTTNSRHNMVYPFYLSEGTNVEG